MIRRHYNTNLYIQIHLDNTMTNFLITLALQNKGMEIAGHINQSYSNLDVRLEQLSLKMKIL